MKARLSGETDDASGDSPKFETAPVLSSLTKWIVAQNALQDNLSLIPKDDPFGY